MSFFRTRRYRHRHNVLTLVDPLTGREWHVRRGSGWPTRSLWPSKHSLCVV